MDFEWLPAGDSEFVAWLNNFREKLAIYAADLSLNLQDLMEVEVDAKALGYVVAQIRQIRQDLCARVQYKTDLRDGPESEYILGYPGRIMFAEPPDVAAKSGVTVRLIRLVNRIKDSSGYTPEIGLELGIEQLSSEQTPWFPKGILPSADRGMVELAFPETSWDGVLVESQRGDDPSWKELGIAYASPFVDGRPLQAVEEAETRRYRLRYVSCGEPVGIYSELIQVVVPTSAQAVKAQLM